MTVSVWSPEAGTPIRLKVEDWSDPTHTCETETKTTVSGEWETLEFDFLNQAPGTESLSIGLSMGWKYNMASIFFNFGTEGATAGEKTYYFDNVKFGDLTLSAGNNYKAEGLSVFPNPANKQWTISTENTPIILIEVFDIQGNRILSIEPNTRIVNLDTSNFFSGIYTAKISTNSGTRSARLMKK